MNLEPCFIQGQRINFQPIENKDIIQLESFLISQYLPDDPLFRAIGCKSKLASIQTDDTLSLSFMRQTKEFLHSTFIQPSLNSTPIVSFKAICESSGVWVALSLANMQYLNGKDEKHDR